MSRWQTRLYAFHFLYLQPAWRTAEPLITATLDTSARAASCAARCVAYGVPRMVESVNGVLWPKPAPGESTNTATDSKEQTENESRTHTQEEEKKNDQTESFV